MIRFRYPIEWDAFDGKPVSVAFAIIAPEETGQEKYLSFLARLARKLVDEEFIESFRKCRNEEEMYEYLLSDFLNPRFDIEYIERIRYKTDIKQL